MPYNDEPPPIVDGRSLPVLYTHDERPVYRAIGFTPPARGIQTTGTFPAIHQPRPKGKPKGKGKR
jgi:hypothetical protein